jgi:hypothetical protein
MNTLGIVFLGIIALCAVVQAGFFLVATVGVLRAAKRIDTLADRAEREWPELSRRLTDATTEVVALASEARQVAERANRTLEKMAAVTEGASRAARTAAELPLKPLRTGQALWQAFRRAISVYRRPDGQTAR